MTVSLIDVIEPGVSTLFDEGRTFDFGNGPVTYYEAGVRGGSMLAELPAIEFFIDPVSVAPKIKIELASDIQVDSRLRIISIWVTHRGLYDEVAEYVDDPELAAEIRGSRSSSSIELSYDEPVDIQPPDPALVTDAPGRFEDDGRVF